MTKMLNNLKYFRKGRAELLSEKGFGMLVGFATAPYVIVTGILLLVYAAAFYGVAKAVKSM